MKGSIEPTRTLFSSVNFHSFYEFYCTLMVFLTFFLMASGVWVLVLTVVVFFIYIARFKLKIRVFIFLVVGSKWEG